MKRKLLPSSRAIKILSQYFYEYLMHKESNFYPEIFASVRALKERVGHEGKKMAKGGEEAKGCVSRTETAVTNWSD